LAFLLLLDRREDILILPAFHQLAHGLGNLVALIRKRIEAVNTIM
jgi:hypothetical protein